MAEQSLYQWLSDKGNQAVDLALAPVKAAVREFSKAADATEKLYRQFYLTRETWVKVKKPFPYETEYRNLSEHIARARAAKQTLLRGMSVVGANPADYGLSVYGLSKSEVDNAYPGLRYNVKEVRADNMAAVPVVLIGAGVLAGIVALTAALVGVVNRYKTINLIAAQKDAYIAAGMSETEAAAKAVADMNPTSPGMFSGLEGAAKYIAIAFGAWALTRIL